MTNIHSKRVFWLTGIIILFTLLISYMAVAEQKKASASPPQLIIEAVSGWLIVVELS
jgi:hypothetical protein